MQQTAFFLSRVITLALIMVLSGCSNLQSVQSFAKSYDQLSDYPALTQNFITTHEREQPYTFGPSEALSQEVDQKRKASQADLIKIYDTLGRYMKTLGNLAGGSSFEIHSADSAIGAAVQEHPEFGITAIYAEAFSKLSTLAAKWAIAQLQANTVRDMIRDGDPSFTLATQGAQSIVRIYRKTAENEKKNFVNFFEIELLTIDPTKNRLLIALARSHYLSQIQHYDQIIQKCQSLEDSLASMAARHRFLVDNSDQLTGQGAVTISNRLVRSASDWVN
jgi:hypothetical protein